MTSPLRPLRVVLIDASDVALSGCRTSFQSDGRFQVIAGANSTGDLDSGISPDLIVIHPMTDGQLDPSSLLSALRLFPNAARLLVTDCCDVDFLLQAFNLGVRGLVSKSRSPVWLLLDAAHAVGLMTSVVVDRLVFERVIGERRNRHKHSTMPGLAAKLSPREIEVLKLLTEGLTDDQLALKLGIAPSTVQTHISNIRHKTPVCNRVQLGIFAVMTGLVDTDALESFG